MATDKLGQERNLKGTRSRSLTASSRSACGLVPPVPCIVAPDGLGYGHIFELVKGKAGGPSYERRRCEAVDASCTANKNIALQRCHCFVAWRSAPLLPRRLLEKGLASRWSSLSSVVTALSRGGTLASTRGGRLSKIGKTNLCACSLSGWLVNRIADRPSTCESAHVSRRLSVVESASTQ